MAHEQPIPRSQPKESRSPPSPHPFDPAGSGVTRGEAFSRLESAGREARVRRPEWVALIEAYRNRLEEEFPGSARQGSEEAPTVAADIALFAGVITRQDGLEPRDYLSGINGFQTKTVRDVTEPAGGIEGAILLPPSGHFAFGAHGTLQLPADRVYASEAYGMLLIGRLGFWGGRRKVKLGSANAGSIVLSGDVPYDGGGMFLTDGFFLPGFLSHIGSLRAETHFARLDHAGEVENPWLFGFRTSLSPHPRIRIGLNRAAVFGGDHEIVPAITFERLFKTVGGLENEEEGRGNFEDQVASLDLWLSPSLGSLPLVIYGEWGVGDLAAQKTDQPAIVAGVEVPGFPGAPWLSVGFESTIFETPNRNVRPWYDHRVFGTWVDNGIVRGHELGGEGSELRLYVGADLLDAGLRIATHGFTRDRKAGNLFSPEREGSSTGFGWTLLWRVAPALDLETTGIVETGSGWKETGAFIGTRLTL